MSSRSHRWGVRFADVRLPRWWSLPVLVALILGRRRQRRDLAEAVESVGGVATIIGERWTERDERERELLALTARVVRLTWALVFLTVAVLAVTVWALLHG